MSYRTGAMTRGIASAIAMATTATINWMLLRYIYSFEPKQLTTSNEIRAIPCTIS
jgi:hypothetical protein